MEQKQSPLMPEVKRAEEEMFNLTRYREFPKFAGYFQILQGES